MRRSGSAPVPPASPPGPPREPQPTPQAAPVSTEDELPISLFWLARSLGALLTHAQHEAGVKLPHDWSCFLALAGVPVLWHLLRLGDFFILWLACSAVCCPLATSHVCPHQEHRRAAICIMTMAAHGTLVLSVWPTWPMTLAGQMCTSSPRSIASIDTLCSSSSAYTGLAIHICQMKPCWPLRMQDAALCGQYPTPS